MAALLDDEIKFCPRCGSRLTRAEKFGHLRPVCPSCNWIYFADPKVAAAALIVKDGKVLLVRRANDPQRGLWTLPAGFVDASEDPAQAMEREALEETGLRVVADELFDVLTGQEHDRGAHILIVYKAIVIAGNIRPGDDVDRVAYFAMDNLPPLAFTTTEKILSLLSKSP